jgi:tetratricopeptide (TPR) repeat protein
VIRSAVALAALLSVVAPLLGACGGSNEAGAGSSPESEEIARADRMLVQGDAAKAGEILRGVLERNTKSFDARYRLGVLAMETDPRASLSDLEGAASLDPSHPGPRFFSGLTRLGLNDFRGSEREMKEGAALDRARDGLAPADTTTPAEVGLVALGRGAYPEARDALSRAIEEKPEDASLWCFYGRACLETKDLQKGAEALTRAVELDDRLPAAQALLAVVRFREGRLKEAADYAQAALDLDPRSATARHVQGLVLLRQSEYRTAALCLWLAVLEDPTVAEHHFSFGEALVRMDLDLGTVHMQHGEWVTAFLDKQRAR